MASSQEVSYTRRDRLCPPLGARPLGPALWYRTPWMMATCMPVMFGGKREAGSGKQSNICAEQFTLRRYVIAHPAIRIDSPK
jgi:hypothetical protein